MEKTAVIIPGDIKMEPGMKIALTLYNGDNVAIAQSIYEYLSNSMQHDIPVPLYGTEFTLHVDDVEIKTSPDFRLNSTKYKITLKGELI